MITVVRFHKQWLVVEWPTMQNMPIEWRAPLTNLEGLIVRSVYRRREEARTVCKILRHERGEEWTATF